MKFGLRYCNTGDFVDPANAVALAQAAEAAGFESVWTIEHTVVPGGYGSTYPYATSGKLAGGDDTIPIPDPLIWMAYVAAATTRINLATGIFILPQHQAAVVAKQVATLDHMSGGRILLGIGAGWLKEEFDVLGVPFEHRGRRTDEYMLALREFWSSDKPTFEGQFIRFKDAYCRPQPVKGHVPLIVGGHSPAAAKRAGRLGDGFFPARGAPKELFDLVRQSAREAGRDPDAIEFTVSLPDNLDDIPALAAMGVKRVLVPVTSMAGLATVVQTPDDALKWRDKIARFASV